MGGSQEEAKCKMKPKSESKRQKGRMQLTWEMLGQDVLRSRQNEKARPDGKERWPLPPRLITT